MSLNNETNLAETLVNSLRFRCVTKEKVKKKSDARDHNKTRKMDPKSRRENRFVARMKAKETRSVWTN